MRLRLVGTVGMLCALLLMVTPVLAENTAIVRDSFTVRFGDFESRGELTYPASGEAPFATVILVHGSGVVDMDHSIISTDPMTGQPVVTSTIFSDIANFLSARGFAVVRYNKRFVNGPNDADWMRYSAEVDLHTMVSDLHTVIDYVSHHPAVDAERLYLYGWSEGSTVAAQAAVDSSRVAGLVLQAPVALPWRETLSFQIYEVGVPYLRSVITDGTVDNNDLFTLFLGGGGMVASGIANYIADPVAAQTWTIQVNPLLDFNGDGVLQIDEEILSGLAYVLDFAFSPMGYFSIYADERALPVLMEQVDRLDLPVLILQGTHDANTPLHGAEQLVAAMEQAGVDVTFRVYEGLGHSLGLAQSLFTDHFAPIEKAPLEDLVRWLSEKAVF